MQNTTLPIQVSSASLSAAPQRANAAPAADANQFSQTLSREMQQRQHSPAAGSQASQPKPQPAPAPKMPPAPAQARPAEGKPAEGKTATASTDASVDEPEDDAADAAAVTPVTDMLALVASFHQPLTAAPAPVSDPLAASVAAQTCELAGIADTQVKADADALAAAGKAQAALVAAPAADDKALALKDVAQVVDGPARFSLKALGGAAALEAKPKDAQPAAPKSILAGANVDAPRAATATAGADSLAALASAAAAKPDAAGAEAVGKVAARTEAAPVPTALPADAAPLRAREGAPDIAALKEPAAAAPVTAPVQQASLAMAQAVAGAPTDKIAARVGTPGWDNQVGQKIVWMVAGKEQSATLTLNPPDMGPMQVVLNVNNDQATVTFSAANPEVRQALENAMPKLREMMGESGIALGNATVNAGTPDQRQAQQGEQSRNQGTGARFGGTSAEAAPVSLTPPRQGRPGGGTGMVDTFA